jgi:hypothetical protein
MLRLSSQSKSSPLVLVAGCRLTGMWTSPKLIAPFHNARVEVAMSGCEAGGFS